MSRRELTKTQKGVLIAAFVPMLVTGIMGGFGTFSNIRGAYGKGTALGAVSAGEGATAVLALVLLGLTMLGQSSPRVIRVGLWALPAAASVMAAMAAPDAGRTVVYAVTPMGMCVSAEGMAFLARRIVVHQDGRDAEAERKAVAVVRALAYHRARAVNHPGSWVRKWSVLRSWRLARRVGAGDTALGERLLEVQQQRLTVGADAALAGMFTTPTDSTGLPDEPVQDVINRSTSDVEQSTPPALAAVEPMKAALPLPLPQPVDFADPLAGTPKQPPAFDRSKPTGRVVASESTRAARRATGRIPKSARSGRPKRTPEQLLAEARAVTADWPDAALTAEAIRKAVRTSVDKARGLRETLRAERGLGGVSDAAV